MYTATEAYRMVKRERAIIPVDVNTKIVAHHDPRFEIVRNVIIKFFCSYAVYGFFFGETKISGYVSIDSDSYSEFVHNSNIGDFSLECTIILILSKMEYSVYRADLAYDNNKVVGIFISIAIPHFIMEQHS